MKKILSTILVIIAIVAIYAGCNYYETHYNREAVVIDIEDENVVVVEDTTGNIWDFEGEGFQKGDKLTMTMWTHCTDSYIYDDEIENVKLR